MWTSPDYQEFSILQFEALQVVYLHIVKEYFLIYLLIAHKNIVKIHQKMKVIHGHDGSDSIINFLRTLLV